MRILHISTEEGFRGGERQLIFIHRGILQSGNESFIATRGNPVLLQEKNAFSYVLPKLLTPFYSLILLRKILRVRPDIIHCHDSRALSFVAVISKFIKARIIFSRKTVYPIRENTLTAKKFSAVTEVVAVSQASANTILERFPQIAVTVIHDGVLNNCTLERNASRLKLGITDNTYLFASVGYFTGEKNCDLILKCADSITKHKCTHKIMLIGKVDDRWSSKVNDHPAIIAVGEVSEAANYYRAFDCYLSTSTQEGLGSALLDAVVRDIPALALYSGGSADIFADKDPYHCMSEPDFLEAFETLLNTPMNQELVKKRGFNARNDFSVDQLQQNHLKLYGKYHFHK